MTITPFVARALSAACLVSHTCIWIPQPPPVLASTPPALARAVAKPAKPSESKRVLEATLPTRLRALSAARLALLEAEQEIVGVRPDGSPLPRSSRTSPDRSQWELVGLQLAQLDRAAAELGKDGGDKLRMQLRAVARAAAERDGTAFDSAAEVALASVSDSLARAHSAAATSAHEAHPELPVLKGRVDLVLELERRDTRIADDGEIERAARCARPFSSGACRAEVTISVDGYSAPLNGGELVDLALRRFYDKLPLSRPAGANVVRSGGLGKVPTVFVEPKTREPRRIPLEIPPARGLLGGALPSPAQPRWTPGRVALPFSVPGAVGMLRPEGVPDGASSDWLITLPRAPSVAESGRAGSAKAPPATARSDKTPAAKSTADPERYYGSPDKRPAGSSRFAYLDGRFSCVGYVTSGLEVLPSIETGDIVKSVRVVSPVYVAAPAGGRAGEQVPLPRASLLHGDEEQLVG